MEFNPLTVLLPPDIERLIIEQINGPGLIYCRHWRRRLAGDTLSLLALACTSKHYREAVWWFIEWSARGTMGRGDGFPIIMDQHDGPWHWGELPHSEWLPGTVSLPDLPEWFWPARVLRALSWVGVAEVHLTGFQSGGNQVAAEVARFLQGPPNARLRLVSLRLGDNDIYDGFEELTRALWAGLAPNLAILDVAGNHGLENPSSERFLRSLLRRSHPCELDLGALRVLDVDVGDTGIVGDTNIRRLLDRLPPSVSLRPVRDNEWRGFSRTAAALRWSEDWYVDRISPP